MPENQNYLTEQLITYIGNKRSLLEFIMSAVSLVQSELGKEKLHCLDMFSGSGIVGRLLKSCSETLTVNDLELYARIINQCYLADVSEDEIKVLHGYYDSIVAETRRLLETEKNPGFITELYAPENTEDVKAGERCFYTNHNARYIDCMRRTITALVPEEKQHFFIAPLLSQASVHANTAGIFKGFYKNSKTGLGQFGGNGKNALSRICGNIELPFPIFSSSKCAVRIFQQEANALVCSEELYENLPEKQFDLVYMDPPYNQHPYGSNYFMLNLIASYKRPEDGTISRVSGIPKNWNRSSYNKKKNAAETFLDLVRKVRAKFIVISFNNEGFISREEMEELLGSCGKVTVLESSYNAFRGSRNLKNRDIHVSEYLFVLDKRNHSIEQ
ncbi:MAG: DNA adenine methylase [Treponema sp.]|nr:DNA adenine methylase [Treponema sp.]